MALPHENYDNASVTQIWIAVGGCVILGIIVFILGLMGAMGQSVNLAKGGFGVSTVVCYAIVIICGFLIMRRMQYALIVATIAEVVDVLLSMAAQMTSSADVSMFIFVKIIAIVCCVQLATKVVTFDEDDGEPPAPRQQNMPKVIPQQQPVRRAGPRAQAPAPRPRR